MKGRQLFQKLSLSVMSVLVTIVAIEVCLHVLNISLYHPKLLCEYDPLLGWRNIPNKAGWFITSEYKVFEEFNSKGIRGPEFSYEKEEGVYRILVLGDSYAEGYTVSLENRFSEVMERELNEGGISVEVINMGTGGYSTDQELLRFESEGVKYHPDLVVLMFCSNDVRYNVLDIYSVHGKPMLIIEDSELKLTNVPVPLNEGSRLRALKRWLLKNSRLYPFVKSRRWLYSIASKLDLNEGDVVPEEHAPEINRAWDVTEAIILRLQEGVKRSGGKLIVFYIPWSGSIYEQELGRVCSVHSIPFIDPTDRFREVASELQSKGEHLNYKGDGHWNINGHRLAGEILAEYIKEFLEQESR